jgi:hypothetical protein
VFGASTKNFRSARQIEIGNEGAHQARLAHAGGEEKQIEGTPARNQQRRILGLDRLQKRHRVGLGAEIHVAQHVTRIDSEFSCGARSESRWAIWRRIRVSFTGSLIASLPAEQVHRIGLGLAAPPALLGCLIFRRLAVILGDWQVLNIQRIIITAPFAFCRIEVGILTRSDCRRHQLWRRMLCSKSASCGQGRHHARSWRRHHALEPALSRK